MSLIKCATRASVVVACCVALCGCTPVKEIRIRNISSRDFSNVRIANQRFGEIPAGETSDYRRVTLRSSYAAMEMTVDGQRITGQTLNVGSDRFTHRIDIIDLDKGHLSIKVVDE